MSDLPPVKDCVFLSSGDGVHQYIIERTGEIWKQPVYCDALFERHNVHKPAVYEWSREISPEDATFTWLDGYLPILEIADKAGKVEVLVSEQYLLVRRNDADVISFPECENPAERFAEELVKRKRHWETFFGQCRMPQIPEGHDPMAWKSCFVQALSSYRFMHPRYGVGHYAFPIHDGFPPTTIAMTDALWQYGARKLSLDLMDYYLERFVLDTGAFDYYGPSLAEYGMLLRNLAAYSSAEEGCDWLQEHRKTIQAIVRLLYRMRNPLMNGEGLPPKARLFKGVPEADTRDVEDIYLHNNAWIWRGLKELACMARHLQWHEMAAEAEAEASDLQQCIRRELARLVPSGGILPYVLKEHFSLGNFMESRDATYANYRYYPELLESGFLSREEALAIIEAREQRQGEFHGMTLFNYGAAAGDAPSNGLPCFGCNNWPIYSLGHAYAMLGETERLHRLIDCHYRYYMSPDCFTAYEGIDADASPRRGISDWCVPAQLAYPRMLGVTAASRRRV